MFLDNWKFTMNGEETFLLMSNNWFTASLKKLRKYFVIPIFTEPHSFSSITVRNLIQVN